MFAPEFGVEVESDEFDGFAEALAGWDRRAGFSAASGVGRVAGRVAAVRRAPFDPFDALRAGRLRMKRE